MIHTIPDECKTIYEQGKEVLKDVRSKIDYDELQSEYYLLQDYSVELDERFDYEDNRLNVLNEEKGRLQKEFFQALDEYDVVVEQYGCDVITC